MPVTVEIPKEKYAGKVREIVIGATKEQGGTRAKTVTIGGESALPFLHFEGTVPHPPALAVEVQSRRPLDWSPVLMDAWKDVVDDPVAWAKAVEALGADLILLRLCATQADGSRNTPDAARQVVRRVLQAVGLPLLIFGPGQADLDNELLVPVAEETKGEKVVLGVCEDKNYRTIVAAAMANDHLVDSRTPMTQQPMLVTPGEEAWRVKEAKVGTDVPAMWGDWAERAVYWETITASALVESGANLLVMRHPTAFKRVKEMIGKLMNQ